MPYNHHPVTVTPYPGSLVRWVILWLWDTVVNLEMNQYTFFLYTYAYIIHICHSHMIAQFFNRFCTYFPDQISTVVHYHLNMYISLYFVLCIRHYMWTCFVHPVNHIVANYVPSSKWLHTHLGVHEPQLLPYLGAHPLVYLLFFHIYHTIYNLIRSAP